MLNETSLNLDNYDELLSQEEPMSISQNSSKKRRRLNALQKSEEDLDFDLGEALSLVDQEVQKEKEEQK